MEYGLFQLAAALQSYTSTDYSPSVVIQKFRGKAALLEPLLDFNKTK